MRDAEQPSRRDHDVNSRPAKAGGPRGPAHAEGGVSREDRKVASGVTEAVVRKSLITALGADASLDAM